MSRLLSRICALAILPLSCASLWFGFYRPLFDRMGADRTKLLELAREQYQLDNLGANLPAMESELKKLRSGHVLDVVLRDGSSPTLLAAELQSQVNAVVAAAGAKLISSLTSPIETNRGFQKLSLDLDFTATTDSLQSLLYLLESATPIIRIDRLSVTAPDGAGLVPIAEMSALLRIQLRLSVFARAGSL